MKSEYVLSMARAFLDGRTDDAIGIIKMMEAAESRSGNVSLARRFQQLTNNRAQMIVLPGAPPGISCTSPARDIDSVILSDCNRRVIDGFIRERASAPLLAEHGIPIRRAILLRGESGNGKTALAEAIAKKISLPLATIQIGQVIDSHMGETGKNLDKAFDFANKCPCVLFFDEADAIVSRRTAGDSASQKESNRMVNTMLMSLDSLGDKSVVIFATNFGECIDGAVLRRISIILDMSAPRQEDIEKMRSAMELRWPIISNLEWVPENPANFAAIECAAIDAAREAVLATATVNTALF